MSKSFSTPMMIQYQRLKAQYADCLLMFRLGDFYELFLDDAIVGAKILGITLTARPRGKDGDIPMAGVPFHSAENYITKLVHAGHKVAICEQVTPAAQGNLVERQIVRVITPSTLLDETALLNIKHQYCLAAFVHKDRLGVAAADATTGDMYLGSFPLKEWPDRLPQLLTYFYPTEILVHPHQGHPAVEYLKKTEAYLAITTEWLSLKAAKASLKNTHQTQSYDDSSMITAGSLLSYFQTTQLREIKHFTKLESLPHLGIMPLDDNTIANLELLEPLRPGTQTSLWKVLNHTQTPMGSRQLKDWLLTPLTDKDAITARHQAVEFFTPHQLRGGLQSQLATIGDVERLLSKLSLGLGNPRDVNRLCQSLTMSLELMSQFKTKPLAILSLPSTNSAIAELTSQIRQQLTTEAPADVAKGNVINPGVNQDLDKHRAKVLETQQWLTAYEAQQRELTKISSLKVKFNQVFGYYIEITRANLDKAPKDYQRKQTMVNGERFTTEELKAKERVILAAQEKIIALEQALFQQLVDQVVAKSDSIQAVAKWIAKLDVLVCFAHLAVKHHWHQAKLASNAVECTNLRHPVVEATLSAGSFVPNDVNLTDNKPMVIITGPNMGGKSVYMRSVALAVIMNQIGSFVPADKATLSVVDRVFVRSGASDNIAKGLSTFMVEMTETGYILEKATKDSLIIMDEIGRGTSTYDGISIAWAIASYIVTNLNAKTLFATHYFEMQELEAVFPSKVRNFSVAIEEHQGEPVFLHRVIPGKAAHSFGIAVAKLAKLPEAVIASAQQKLKTLDSLPSSIHQETFPPSLNSELISKIQSLDIARLTPLEALNLLAKLQEELD